MQRPLRLMPRRALSFVRPVSGSVSLGFLALLAVLPLLQPRHMPPLASFWGDWLAIALGLAGASAIFLTRSAWRRCPLPTTLLAPTLLVGVLVVQIAVGRIITVQQSLLHAAYLLWLAGMLVLGRQLADRRGLAAIADVLAPALLAGALLSAGIGLAQHLYAYPAPSWIFPGFGQSYGNFGQRNHQTDYVWLGIASAFYLHARCRLSKATLTAACALLLAASILAGARSSFLYAVVIPLLAVWARQRTPNSLPAGLVLLALSLLPALLALNGLPHWLPSELPGTDAAIAPAERLYREVSGPAIRIALAKAGWAIFLQNPILGSGAGSFPWQSFLYLTNAPTSADLHPAEHAHNIIIDLASDFGGPAALAVLAIAGLWWWRVLKGSWNPESWWGACVVAIISIHSLLEYPLWYAYFSGIAAVVVGAMDRSQWEISPGWRGVAYSSLALAGGVAILIALRADYGLLEAVNFRSATETQDQAWQRSIDDMVALRQKSSLLTPWAGIALVALMDVDRDHVEHRQQLCEQAMRLSPGPKLVAKCAMLQAIGGRNEDAQSLIRQLMTAYPAEGAATVEEISRYDERYPELRPLRLLVETLGQRGQPGG